MTLALSDVALTTDAALVNDAVWSPWRAHDKHGRSLFKSSDGKYILKTEMITDEIPECWAEGLVWIKWFSHLAPGKYVKFNPILATGSAIVDGEICAWSIAPFVDGPNGYANRDQCPQSPYFTHVIAEARSFAKSCKLNDRDLTFPGQYQYEASSGLAICIDYGKTLKGFS